MIEEILSSKMKIRIVRLLARSRGEMQVSDVARTLRVSKSRASECLRELERAGVLTRRQVGRSVVYRLAETSLAKHVSVVATQETTLISTIERALVRRLKGIKATSVALFGSSVVELRVGGDIDVIVIAHRHKGVQIGELSADLTEKLGINVSIISMSEEEFRRKAREGEEFVLNILANHKLLLGKRLEDVVWSGK